MFTDRRLLHLLRQTGILFPLVVLFGLIAGGLVVLQASKLSQAISAVFLDGKTLAEVMGMLRIFLVIVLARVIFTILTDSFANWVAIKVKTMLRTQLMQKIDRLGTAYTHDQQSGELITTAIQGVEALDAYFSQYLPQVLLAAFLPLIIVLVVFPVDWVSGLIFLITAPLIPFFMSLVGKSAEKETKKQWKALSRLGADFLDTLQGLTTLKILGQSRNRLKQVEEISNHYRLATMNVLRITFLSALVLELLATISTAVIAVEIGLRLLYGQVAFQQAFFVLLLAPEFYLPLRNLGIRYHAGMTGVTASVRIFQLLAEPEPIRIQTADREPPNLNLHQAFTMTFNNVSFQYSISTQDSLQNIQMDLLSGRAYSLVGRSGAGKSTLLKLIMRFIEPTNGNILINGIDLREYPIKEWRKHISWVAQKPMLFNSSLLENIRLEDLSIEESEVWRALEQTQLADFVMELPEKLQTPIGEWGSRLSGGQAQRVALARAFLKNAPLLLLDEPSSHLDPDLENSLLTSMQTLMEGKTVITIAHRFSTIRRSDEMIVIDKGKLIKIGNPQKLLENNQNFDDLYPAGEVTL
ncbi:MAG: thiol reductant ABC exporter subunit CydD [Anaerolineaceae bacterium]